MSECREASQSIASAAAAVADQLTARREKESDLTREWSNRLVFDTPQVIIRKSVRVVLDW